MQIMIWAMFIFDSFFLFFQFQLMTSAPNDSCLSPNQDTNQFLKGEIQPHIFDLVDRKVQLKFQSLPTLPTFCIGPNFRPILFQIKDLGQSALLTGSQSVCLLFQSNNCKFFISNFPIATVSLIMKNQFIIKT